jgi:hypothetical protein
MKNRELVPGAACSCIPRDFSRRVASAIRLIQNYRNKKSECPVEQLMFELRYNTLIYVVFSFLWPGSSITEVAGQMNTVYRSNRTVLFPSI